MLQNFIHTDLAMFFVVPLMIVFTMFWVSRYAGRELDHANDWEERIGLWMLYFIIFVSNLFFLYIFMAYHEIWLADKWGINLN